MEVSKRATPDGHVPVLPLADAIGTARSHLLTTLPDRSMGNDETKTHIQQRIVPGLNRSSQSSKYYGFVTGGATPAALFADKVVSETDQNVQVHLPSETVATDVEDRALIMVCELLDLAPHDWPHRTFTTGATASNILGLACGRDFVVRKAARKRNRTVSVAEDGILLAMNSAGMEAIQVLTTVPHSSLRKAASVVGLGRSSVIDVGLPRAPHRFNLSALEARLATPGVASVVVISCGEVNTGYFATNGKDLRVIRKLCDDHGAWLHVDAAFGLLARALPHTEEYEPLNAGVTGLEVVDSITGDAHKLLNVPYDCGIFISRHLRLATEVFQNANAVYLNTASSEVTTSKDRTIPSPLNIGIENSRRFRALPVYATLAAYGREGYRDMLERQIRLARGIASFIIACTDYELLPKAGMDVTADVRLREVYIIVLFRAKDSVLNRELVQRINATRRLYISGTQWDGQPAARFAVANWQADPVRDLQDIKDVLYEVLQ